MIKKDYLTYGIFIDDPEQLPTVTHGKGDDAREMTSTEVWNAMRNILDTHQDRWERKKHLRLLRPALLQFVIQVPAQYLPDEVREAAGKVPFVRCTNGGYDETFDYTKFYSLTTGYFKPSQSPLNVCF